MCIRDRLIQEALNNVVKHAGAGHAEVTVREDDSVVNVAVHDDGRGFTVDEPGAGFGLTGMRERVELLGGSLTIESAAGHGTTVRATVPATHREEESPRRELSAG